MNCQKIFPILLACLALSCSSDGPKSPFDFPANGKPVYELASTKIIFEQILSPKQIEKKGNSLIVIADRRIPIDQPVMHIIDLKTLAYVMPKGVNGLGPNEITNAQLFDPGFSDSTFWVNSTRSKRMAEFSLYDTSQLSIRQFKQPQSMFAAYFVQMITDSTFLCLVSSDHNRFVEYGMDGKRIKGYGNWEPIPNRPGLTDNMIADVNTGWFKVDRNANLFVKASLYRDRIEIFDYKTKEFIYVDGPRLGYPDFEVLGSGENAGVYIKPEVKYGHRDISFSDRFIYVLYGVYNYQEFVKTSKLAETIHILTKKGEVVAKLNLDISLSSITVDETLGKIYGITTDEEPGIAVFDIPAALLKKD